MEARTAASMGRRSCCTSVIVGFEQSLLVLLLALPRACASSAHAGRLGVAKSSRRWQRFQQRFRSTGRWSPAMMTLPRMNVRVRQQIPRAMSRNVAIQVVPVAILGREIVAVAEAESLAVAEFQMQYLTGTPCRP